MKRMQLIDVQQQVSSNHVHSLHVAAFSDTGVVLEGGRGAGGVSEGVFFCKHRIFPRHVRRQNTLQFLLAKTCGLSEKRVGGESAWNV